MTTAAFRRTAHDPGDAQITSHCPFCGSGQVVGRSDGNIECSFCGMTYLVRIQPMFTGMPGNPAPGFGGETSMAPDLMDPAMVGPDGMPMGEEMGEPPPGEDAPPFGDEEAGEGPPDDEAPDDAAGPPPAADDDSGAPPPKGSDTKKKPSKSKKGARTAEGRRKTARVEDSHEDMSEAELRAHMRQQHGYWDSPDDPDAVIDQTHKDEHADYKHDHVHPDLEHEHDLDLHLGDRDWMHQNGIEASRRIAASKVRRCKFPSADGKTCGELIIQDQSKGPYRHQDPALDEQHEAQAWWSAPGAQHEGRRYRTIAGDVLPEAAYMRHLAVLHGGTEILRSAGQRP